MFLPEFETDVEHTRDSALLARERWQDCSLCSGGLCRRFRSKSLFFPFIPSSSLPARAHDASVPTPEAGHELTQEGVLSDMFPVAFCASERTRQRRQSCLLRLVGRRCSLVAAGSVVRMYVHACQPLHHAVGAHKKCSSCPSED